MAITKQSMTAEHFQRIESLVLSALELTPAERAELLTRECNGNEELRREVEALLSFESAAESFISKPAIALVASSLAAGGLTESVAGQRLGSYRLARELGHGGMGAVYLAERADEYQKQVAIKVVKRGLATHDLMTRFRSERQILAGLDHPNIARLLDGGTTEDGAPYIVMDYVEGVSIDDYCERNSLSTPARLKLFCKVCSAVTYAHSNLVVHRDLKPSNIIVQGDGTPKLLDFGIAKILSSEVLVADDQTATVARVMTPQYASPEQIRGGVVTTASDIYSLGVLLYKLLSGQLPYQLKNRTTSEVEKIICEHEPPKPSSVMAGGHESSNGETQSKSVVLNRKSVRGDLDKIILKALNKEPARRYKSVDHLTADIERHLNGFPVRARSNTLRYRAERFVSRHRLALMAAALIAIAVIGGVVATLRQARNAERERAKAESVNAFLTQMLKYSNPFLNPSRKNDRETTVDDLLDEAARRLESGEFDRVPEVKAELEHTIAETYFGQGRYHEAAKHMQAFVDLTRQLYGENDPKTVVASVIGAGLLFSQGSLTESETAYRAALPHLRSQYKAGKVTPLVLAEALNNFAYLRRTLGDSAEAESLFRETLALMPLLSNEQRIVVATTRSTLASTLADQGRFGEALQTAREAVGEFRQRGETTSPAYGFALVVLGGFLTEAGNFAEADSALHDSEAIFRSRLAPLNLWLGDNLRNQSISLYRQGKYPEALTKADEAAKIYLESFGTRYDHYPTTLIVKGLSLARMGQTQEGERLLREAVKIRNELLPKGHFWVAVANGALGECLLLETQYEEAEPLLVESYKSLQASLGPQDPRTKEAVGRLVQLYLSWGKPGEAARYRAL